MHTDKNLAVHGGKTDVPAGVTDITDNAARKFLPVDLRLCGNLAGNHNEIGRAECFTRDTALGILFQACVEDSVRNLVADLVRMSFRNGLGSEDVFGINLAHESNSLF